MNSFIVDPYLTEDSLGKVLLFIFNNCKIESQYPVKNDLTGSTLRIDYCVWIDNQKLFFEFNGYGHYTNTNTIYRDFMLKEWCKLNKVFLVEIPYFIQLTNPVIEFLFPNIVRGFIKDKIIEAKIPNGFHEKKIILPYDFVPLGVQRYLDFMESFKICKKEHNEILDSLKNRNEKEKLLMDFYDKHQYKEE